jgi:hypothetical protein
MQDGCEVYMGSYMASNGSCFYCYLDYLQKPSLGGIVGLTQNRETMALRMLTTVDLFYFMQGPT